MLGLRILFKKRAAFVTFHYKIFPMALYYGKHKVRDYESWRPYFDNDQPRLQKVGAKCLNVMRSTNDPNEVHFIFDVPDLQAFFGALQDPETAGIMQQAGVLEQPTMYRLDDFMSEMQQDTTSVTAQSA